MSAPFRRSLTSRLHAWQYNTMCRRGGRYGWKSKLFELILLLKLDTVPCRAIRGNCISVNSTLPPLNVALALALALVPVLVLMPVEMRALVFRRLHASGSQNLRPAEAEHTGCHPEGARDELRRPHPAFMHTRFIPDACPDAVITLA